MSRRLLLKRQLYSAWKSTIEQYYGAQQINSERGLQVFFCAELLSQFHRKGLPRRLFIETQLISSNARNGPCPDILICNSRRIIGIVEMKYLPRAGARTEKDLKTLTWCATHADRIGVRNDRYLGPGKTLKHYSLASDAVLCWAGVHRSDDIDLGKRVSSTLSPYFMELHAVTAKNEQPARYSNFRPRKRF